MPPTREETLAFIETAPVRIVATHRMAHSPAAVFDALADTDSWPAWFPNLSAADWTTPPPHGVDSRRKVRVGPATIHERFIAWDPGRRWAFTFTAVSGLPVPLARAGVECVDLVEDGDGTKVSYTMAIEPPGLLTPVVRAANGALRSALRKGLLGLERHLDAGATTPS